PYAAAWRLPDPDLIRIGQALFSLTRFLHANRSPLRLKTLRRSNAARAPGQPLIDASSHSLTGGNRGRQQRPLRLKRLVQSYFRTGFPGHDPARWLPRIDRIGTPMFAQPMPSGSVVTE